jgi:hypothetical protein
MIVILFFIGSATLYSSLFLLRYKKRLPYYRTNGNRAFVHLFSKFLDFFSKTQGTVLCVPLHHSASIFVLSGAPQTEQGRSLEYPLSLLIFSKETGLRGQYMGSTLAQHGSA